MVFERMPDGKGGTSQLAINITIITIVWTLLESKSLESRVQSVESTLESRTPLQYAVIER